MLRVKLLKDKIVVAADSSVGITSALGDETFEMLEILEIDCVGERSAFPIVEWPKKPTCWACKC